YPGRGLTVDVLGRYRFLSEHLPRSTPENLRVRFRTVHSAKGLEADHVVVLGLDAGTYGFPSSITDDPVLDLAMPIPETFAHAEERRLLYVAMTRARHSVTLIVSSTRPSPFAAELSDHPEVSI